MDEKQGLSDNWRPAASLAAIKGRALLLRTLREYFDAQAVLEVVTPVVSNAATTDPQIESLSTSLAPLLPPVYLHTSPEFAMKRLLCADAGDIYQICTVFRSGESGRHHNPEFQMLEWYRLGFDHFKLMEDVQAMVQVAWQTMQPGRGEPAFTRISYHEAIKQCTGFDLAGLGRHEIAKVLADNDIDCPLSAADALDVWLDLLMSTVVAASFDATGFTFLYNYPPSQAALARIYLDTDGVACAARFELYYGALELANGFHELQDANEQQARFEKDIKDRQEANKPEVPFDRNLIAALHQGLPDCAGVAIGLDRLLLLLLQASHLHEVVTFPVDRA